MIFCGVFCDVFCDLWYSNLQDEVICSEGWGEGAISFLFSTDTIHTLAKFLHVVIGFQECCNLRIARKVGIANAFGSINKCEKAQ